MQLDIDFLAIVIDAHRLEVHLGIAADRIGKIKFFNGAGGYCGRDQTFPRALTLGFDAGRLVPLLRDIFRIVPADGMQITFLVWTGIEGDLIRAPVGRNNQIGVDIHICRLDNDVRDRMRAAAYRSVLALFDHRDTEYVRRPTRSALQSHSAAMLRPVRQLHPAASKTADDLPARARLLQAKSRSPCAKVESNAASLSPEPSTS